MIDKDIGTKGQARRQNNTVLNREAVTRIFQSALLNECRVERVMTGMVAQSQASGSEVASMLPRARSVAFRASSTHASRDGASTWASGSMAVDIEW